MAYFVDHLENVRLPVGIATDTSLRRGQRGAVHAIASHFTRHQAESAIIVMPTGSGKTAVMMLTPFLLEANRVLVITPSRLVRSQIATEFQSLAVLQAAGVLVDLPNDPAIHEVEKRIVTADGWEDLRSFDVVVAIPTSISPAYSVIPDPPAGLFDLVLVDEAHHSPANTWNQILEAFPAARRILFTATPFRRDKREIKGKFIYTYPVTQAYEDGIFGTIEYISIDPEPDNSQESTDIAIAQRAEAIFRADREAGFDHALMVRTDVRTRADQLAALYAAHTSLNLRLIHSGLGYATVRATIDKLRSRQLDGIICVDMLGEGFDFPNLKIAAIHAPHKSLAVTLQFIGRFARTKASSIGSAKFLAVPAEIMLEAVQLYEEGAVWQEIVPNLLEKSVEREVWTREVFDTFEVWEELDGEQETDDVSLYALQPYYHVKVFDVSGAVDLDTEISLGKSYSIERRWTSHDWSASIFITKEESHPRWANLNLFPGVKYDLFIVYHNPDSRFLFICASRRHDALYQRIADQFCPGGTERVTQGTVKKALHGLTDHELFMVGMRSQLHNSNTESYRMIAGPNANKAIRPTDSRQYLQGHSFGRARDGDETITIGWSSSAKVWSNTSSRVADFLVWCEKLAMRLASNQPVVTGSELDLLRMSETVTSIPDGVIAALWDEGAYTRPWRVTYTDNAGQRVHGQLLDLELVLDRGACSCDRICVSVVGEGMSLPIDFSLNGPRLFALLSADHYRVVLERGRQRIDLIDYLNSYPPVFFFWDFSSLVGRDYSPSTAASLPPFHRDRVEAIDWSAANVDIEVEFGTAPAGKCSIHGYLAQQLLDDGCDVVFYDHEQHEVADYVSIREDDHTVHFDLYHCKGSERANPGRRVDDLYEVCGQVVKSLRWVNDNAQLARRLEERARARPERFIRGDRTTLEMMITASQRKRSSYRLILVQPGLSQAKLTDELGRILAAADDYVVRWGCDGLRVLGSA